MNNYKLCNGVLALAFMLLLSTPAVGSWSDNAQWYDEFYQYRIPVEVTVSSTGLQQLSIASDTIVNAINLLEDIDYSTKYFDYNRVKLVEYDDNGSIVDVDDSSGYYISYAGPELITNGSFENETGGVAANWSWNYNGSFNVVSGQSHDGSKCLEIDSTVFDRQRIYQGPKAMAANTPYVFSFWCKHEATDYGVAIQVADVNNSWSALTPSHDPYLRSKYWRQYQVLYDEPNSLNIQAQISRNHVGRDYVDDVSFRQASIDFVFAPSNTGPKKYMLYYQPTQSMVRMMPGRWLATVPAAAAALNNTGPAQRYDSIVKYSVYSGGSCDIWFAETTQKITPAMPVPALQKSAVTIECAQNERQSFQLVLKPKTALTIDTATISALTTGSDTIPAGTSYVKIVDYVNIYTPSRQASNLIPRIADILEAFSVRALSAGGENTALWFTVIVDAGVAPGVYSGTISVGVDGSTIDIPLQLTVHKFALPDRMTFRTAHGTNWFGYSPGGGTTVYEFHGVTTTSDKKQLLDAYYDVMLDNKDCPYGINAVNWYYQYDPPPWGYNYDYPGNYFSLHDFDFTDWNAGMNYWFNTRSANSMIIGHMNGYHANYFKFLDGFTVAWDHPDPSFTAITQLQYETLIIDFWEEMAWNLIINGWIDYAYILIDETRTDNPAYDYAYGFKKMKHFMEVLKSNPLTAQIKIMHTINYQAAYTWKEFPDTDTEIAFKDLIDIWTPMMSDDDYCFYEPYNFTEYNMDPTQEEIWFYTVSSAHQNIDTNGLNNRCLPMKSYFFNSTGFLHWAAILYEQGPGGSAGQVNPRIDPYFVYGNGSVNYFYPPGDTVTPTPDFTITPAARLEMFREGIEDFEYMVILDNTMTAASAAGIDTSNAVSLKEQMQRMFTYYNRWSVNDEYYLLMRKRIMDEIDTLNWYITYGLPGVEITGVSNNNNQFTVDVYASNRYRYNLLRADQLTNPQWQVVDTAFVETSDTITLTDASLGGSQKAFYRVEVVIP